MALAGVVGARPSVLLLSLLMFVFFYGFNVLEASMPSMASRLSPKNIRGASLGVYNTLQSLGIFAGGAFGGWLAKGGGTPGLFLCCALLMGVWLAVAWAMVVPPPHATPAATPAPANAPPTLPPTLTDAVLRADLTTLPALVGVDLGADGYVVVRVNKRMDRTPPEPAVAQQELAQYAQWLARAEGAAYLEMLKSEFKVQFKVPRPADGLTAQK